MTMTVLFLAAALVPLTQSSFRAGVGKVDLTPPVGAPLGGFFARHWSLWPLPNPLGKYNTLFRASTGVRDPLFAKALILEDASPGGTSVAHVTMDVMAPDEGLTRDAHDLAVADGFSVAWNRTLFHASHSHSSFGGYTAEPVLELAVLDKLNPELRRHAARKIADAMVAAQRNLQPARLGVGQMALPNVTCNRRAYVSPNDNASSVDPLLGVLRVDAADAGDGEIPIATLWNLPVHGTCLSDLNLQLSADIMGNASSHIESLVGGVALFVNSDAGDIAPSDATCGANANGTDATFAGGAAIAAGVAALRADTDTSAAPQLRTASLSHDFGPTNANLSLFACAPQEISCLKPVPPTPSPTPPSKECVLTRTMGIKAVAQHVHLGAKWVNTVARFSAVRLTVGGRHTLLVSIPGEAIHDIGSEIRGDIGARLRRDGAAAGFDATMLLGYTNNYFFYFTTPKEYDIGGYEPQMSLWGRHDGEMVRQQCAAVAKLVLPPALPAASGQG